MEDWTEVLTTWPLNPRGQAEQIKNYLILDEKF